MLTNCPTCNESASSNAFACPHCGEPIQQKRYVSAFRTLALVWAWVLTVVFIITLVQMIVLNVALRRMTAGGDLGIGSPVISWFSTLPEMAILLVVAWLPYLGWHLAAGRIASHDL